VALEGNKMTADPACMELHALLRLHACIAALVSMAAAQAARCSTQTRKAEWQLRVQ